MHTFKEPLELALWADSCFSVSSCLTPFLHSLGRPNQVQEDYMGKAATWWPNAKPPFTRRTGWLGKGGLGKGEVSLRGETPAGAALL